MESTSHFFYKNKSLDKSAGVPSGFIERFELEKYNPKLLESPHQGRLNKTYENGEQSNQRRYITQTEMKAHRVKQERSMIQKKMKEWEDLHPYFIDQRIPEKPKSK